MISFVISVANTTLDTTIQSPSSNTIFSREVTSYPFILKFDILALASIRNFILIFLFCNAGKSSLKSSPAP
jgi:amino acid permease